MNTIEPIKSDNRVNFGMQYKNPRKWGAKTLQSFMDSDLRIDIDKKYPNASASYKVVRKKVSRFFERKEYSHKLTFNLNLEQGRSWEYKNTMLNTPDLLDEMLAKKIRQTSLEMLENDISRTIKAEKTHKEYIAKAEEENKKHKKSFKNILSFLGL